MDQFLQTADNFILQHRRKTRWQQIVSVLGCIVVFCTVYALILPAITLQSDLICGMEEHVHTEECYEIQMVQAPPEMLCTEADLIDAGVLFIHQHHSLCYDDEDDLICPLEEIEEHTHDADCFIEERTLICDEEEDPGHYHEDTCYTYHRGELCCGQVEEEGHAHGTDCYEQTETLICDLPEDEAHAHDGNCYDYDEVLLCGSEEYDGHSHTDDCYDWIAELRCPEEEQEPGHLHEEDCYVIGVKRGCQKDEVIAHEHDASCVSPVEDPDDYDLDELYTVDGQPADEDTEEYYELICEQPVVLEHRHTSACVHYPEEEAYETRVLICELEEHVHDDSCEPESEFVSDHACGLSEHMHDSFCFDEADELICSLSEHLHDEECMSVEEEPMEEIGEELPVYYCGWMEHMHDELCFDEEGFLLCEEEEHLHDELCTGLPEPDRFCGMEEHEHDDDCWDENGELVCELPEHEHTEGCGVDLTLLTEVEQAQVAQVVRLIEEIPSADEIDDRMYEFEEAEDYEGEEAWLTEVYREIAWAYNRYANLSETLQACVWNADKLLELEYIWSAVPMVVTEIAQTTSYNSSMFTADASFVLYTVSNGKNYAFDGNGNAVEVQIDSSGTIMADVSDKNLLLWSFERTGNNTYAIRNLATGRYMHAYPNNGSGVTTTGKYTSTLQQSGSGVRIRSNNEYARLDRAAGKYVMTQSQSLAAVYQFGVSRSATLWLDGTNGGLLSLSGSDTANYSVATGDTFKLPETWKSPTKYAYTLRGWYDVTNHKYYAPGSQITVTGSALFYADWVAETYDIGRFNSQVADTVSTADFITTHVFDYGTLFNTLSSSATVSSGNATWNLLSSGIADGSGEESLNFIFIDYDGGGDISYPNNRNADNTSGEVNFGLYNEALRDILFDTDNEINPATGTGILGKTYLGTADHLFQYGADPSDEEHYGYYYYDSMLNAASYNQSEQRFYVYEYLERTADSARDGGEDSYADFLPLNSPYANTNGKSTKTYTYRGENGEYAGVNHHTYDTKYSDNHNSTNNVMTNFWFGMSTDFEFYLSSKPGTVDSEGNPANLGLSGNPMVFEFSGDDDVWVLIDDNLVLDIGGIHGIKSGSINFSTGDVIVDGNVTGNVRNLTSGRHKLTMYYLERGSSKSNFKLRFNISPRYELSLRKEDTLTAHLLNGAEFSVYMDRALTQPAELWKNRAAYERDENPTNVFKVEDGEATMWGFAAGNTYYIIESKGPDEFENKTASGIIQLTLNNQGSPDYKVLANPTVGFTVHGYKVNEDKQEAYLVITNSENTTEATEIYVEKRWSDNADHSSTPVTVYLLANGKRIREVVLNENNDWQYVWENMPKFDGAGNEVVYTVEEATVPGYIGRIEAFEGGTSSGGNTGGSNTGSSSGGVTAVSTLENGKTYLLGSTSGYLAASNNKLYMISGESNAKASSDAQWTVTTSGNTLTLRNGSSQTLYYEGYAFRAAAQVPSNGTKDLHFSNGMLYYSYNHGSWVETLYPGATNIDTYNGVIYTKNNTSEALSITPYVIGGSTSGSGSSGGSSSDGSSASGFNYRITNTPVSVADIVSLQVHKAWDLGNMGEVSMYETQSVLIRLLANGVDSGLTTTLSLKNDWTGTFANLPKRDSSGKEIVYTVVEEPLAGWSPKYGEIRQINGTANQYEVTVTNVYNMIYELPETGGFGSTLLYTAGGAALFTAAAFLMYNHKKRRKEDSP